MGAWGTSLYSNDSTCDIRGEYIDKLKRGKTNAEATRELIEENSDYMGDTEEESLFWFALADTQWNYGRLLPQVKEKALYFLAQTDELERWRNAGEKQLNAWIDTLRGLKKKLETSQPAEKKVSKYRLYKCNWKYGDVFAYRFSGDDSREKGLWGKYAIFRKISEDFWWPGHIVPVVHFYKKIWDTLPELSELRNIELLPSWYGPSFYETHPTHELQYEYILLKESSRGIPWDRLTFLGNLPGDDMIPYSGPNYWKDCYPLGWEASKYDHKIEETIIRQYAAWCIVE